MLPFRLGLGNVELEGGHGYVNLVLELIETMKGTGCSGGKVGHVITVVGKGLPRFDGRCFTYDFLSFHDGGRAVAIGEYPLAAQESYGAVT